LDQTQLGMTYCLAWRCLALIVAFAPAMAFSGCVADQKHSLIIPAGAPQIAGPDRQGGREHDKLVAAFGGEYYGPGARALFAEVTERLVAATDGPRVAFQIAFLDSPIVNAFSTPNGRIYVTRGLIALANDTAEIAAVLAHEIAHATLRHSNAPTALRDGSRTTTTATFSRQQELEADQLGVRTLARAGYDPYAASRFLTGLERASGRKGESGDMLSTHPSTPARIRLVLAAARRVGAPGSGERDRERYLTTIDGMAFGALHLEVVNAGASDTAETLAGRMAVNDDAVKRFLTLNGLEGGAAIKPSERYKILVE
jgi:predicted Zn-dependent protease